MEKQILFILEKAPYGSSSARESVDAILAACAFGQQVDILALEDGLFQFTNDQQAEAIGLKNTAAMLASLPLYGTERFYSREADLKARHLTNSDFVIPTDSITNQQIQRLIGNADVVLTY